MSCYSLHLVLPVFLLALFPARAADPDTLRPARGLEEIVVVGKATGFDITSPVPSQILSGERLEQLNSFSVADAARYFSGVQLKDYGGIGGLKTINVRDLGGAHVALFLDGMPVSDARGGQVDLGRYSLDNLEAIELYNAQRPTLLQPARGFFASSVLLLRSKTPRLEPGTTRHVTVTARAGSFGLLNPSLSWHQGLSRGATLSASLAYLRADGKYKCRYTNGVYDTTIVRQNGDIVTARAELSLHLPLSDRTLLSLKGYHYSSERGLPGPVLAGRFSNEQRQADRSTFFHASFRSRWGDRHRLLINAKYNRDYSRYTDPAYLVEGGLVNTCRQGQFYLSAAHALLLAPWCELSLAVDLARDVLSSDARDFPFPSRHSAWGALSVQATRERLSVQANLLGCLVDERVKSGKPRDDQRVLCPVLSLSWQPFDARTFRVRAFYKRSFRVPTFNDLYYTPLTPATLRPEFTVQRDVGVAWEKAYAGLLSTVAVQGDAFYNRVKDKIIAFPAGNIERWTMINLGEVAITGSEVNARAVLAWNEHASVRLGLTYTWQRAIDLTPGDTRGARLPYSPAHAGTLTAACAWRAWHLHYCFIYTGDRFFQRDNTPESREPPWYTHDLSIGYRRVWRDIPFRVNVEINNLLNHYYDVVRNYPMPGRSCRVTLSINS
ncbi:MAG: TonB-dependent receptor [Odoribacteraceae bacterium]|jgi:hypothetical protein|nr:TonB-dependent receptor [Odoribacteraceae bacterium]